MAKRTITTALLAATFAVAAFAARAGIPVKWTADTFKVKPLSYECYHGETLDLAAALTAYGEPLALGGKTAKLYWQTADMGAEWYETNATVAVDAETGATNILAATFSGAYDTGKDAVKGFVGVVGENYRAAFELKFRASPGFEPSALPLPAKTIDCAKVTFLNPTNAPWSTGGGECLVRDVLTNGVSAVAGKVARLVIPSTNGLCTVAAAQGMANAAEANAKEASFPIEGGEVEGNITYGDATFGEVSEGIDGLKVGDATFGTDGLFFPNAIWIPQDTSGSDKPYLIGDWYIGDVADENKIAKIGDISGTSVTNLGAVVAATNAVANSDNLWTAGNTKLTATIDGRFVATNTAFSNAVLSVGLNIDTNAVAVLNEIASGFGGFPIQGTATTVGGLLAALAAAIAWLKRETLKKGLSAQGVPSDTNVASLFSGENTSLNGTIDGRLPIPLESKTDSFTAADGHAYAVTMTGTVTITMPTIPEGNTNAITFCARFSAAADQSVQFSTDAVIKFDGTDCGAVKAGKAAILSAMWNGSAWDLVWKNQA